MRGLADDGEDEVVARPSQADIEQALPLEALCGKRGGALRARERRRVQPDFFGLVAVGPRPIMEDATVSDRRQFGSPSFSATSRNGEPFSSASSSVRITMGHLPSDN